MSQIKLTADSGGGSVSLKAPATTTGNAALEITVPDVATGSSVVTADSSGNVTASGTLTASNFSNRNIVINGACNVAQRGATSTADGIHTVDRMMMAYGGENETPTQAQITLTSSDTGPWAKGFRNAFQITNGNQTGGAGVTDYLTWEMALEAQDIANSGWDYTSASSKITLSFWVKSSVAQDFKGYLKTEDGTEKAYPFATGSLSANTWTKITKTIPGEAGLTFNNDNGKGLVITINPMLGTDKTASSATENTWQAWSGSARHQDVTTTFWTTNDATFAITGIQLEVGDVATEFEHRSYVDELTRCQRYYHTTAQAGTEAYQRHGLGFSPNTSRCDTVYWLHPPMRTTPSGSSSGNFKMDGHTTRTVTSITYQHPTNRSVTVIFNDSGSGMNADTNWLCRSDNDATARINFDAEL